MALAALAPVVEAMPEGFLPVALAAQKMGGMNPGHLRRLCAEKFEQAGLAIKRGDEWIISKKADPRLGDIETQAARDLRQADELRKEGWKATAIRKAERSRDLILAFYAFTGHSRSEGGLCVEFVNKCLADGTFRAHGVKEYKPDTFRKLCYAYRNGGLRALVRKPYADRGSRTFGTRALAYFLHVMKVGHGITVADALKDLIGHVIQNGWRAHEEWKIPALRTAQLWWRNNVPEPAKVLIAEGPNKLRAKCIPKIARNALEDFAAGDLLVLDERNFDFMCRALGERGWYSYRPKLTALRDAVSGMIVGWHIGPRANSDTILAALKQAFLAMETVCRELIFDNGPGEKVVGGRSRKGSRWDSIDEPRILTAAGQMGIDVHFARVRAPWAKSIESSFAALKVFDRFQVAFTGGSPAEKPWDMVNWTKQNILELPTIDQVREQFTAFLDAYHEEPRRSDITEGLSPRQAFRQFYTAAPRRITRDTLDALCRKIIGPVKVGRDGVKHDRLRYGTRDEAVFKLQGQQVWIAVDPIERDSVILCEQDGTPICTANVDRPLGYKSDEVREAIAYQRRCEKSVKQYAPSRDYLLKTTPQQIAERRKLAAQERQIPDKHLAPRAEPISVQLVRPDIAVAAEKLKRAAGAETLRRLHGTNAAAEAVNRPRRLTLAELNSKTPAAEPEKSPRRNMTLKELCELTEKNQHATG